MLRLVVRSSRAVSTLARKHGDTPSAPSGCGAKTGLWWPVGGRRDRASGCGVGEQPDGGHDTPSTRAQLPVGPHTGASAGVDACQPAPRCERFPSTPAPEVHTTQDWFLLLFFWSGKKPEKAHHEGGRTWCCLRAAALSSRSPLRRWEFPRRSLKLFSRERLNGFAQTLRHIDPALIAVRPGRHRFRACWQCLQLVEWRASPAPAPSPCHSSNPRR